MPGGRGGSGAQPVTGPVHTVCPGSFRLHPNHALLRFFSIRANTPRLSPKPVHVQLELKLSVLEAKCRAIDSGREGRAVSSGRSAVWLHVSICFGDEGSLWILLRLEDIVYITRSSTGSTF